MTKTELEKLAMEIEFLAASPDTDESTSPVELLSSLYKEAEMNLDNNYVTSIVHGILGELENMR